jgi:hypothetical protein
MAKRKATTAAGDEGREATIFQFKCFYTWPVKKNI